LAVVHAKAVERLGLSRGTVKLTAGLILIVLGVLILLLPGYTDFFMLHWYFTIMDGFTLF